jgi:hypothetical protein
MRVQGIPKKVIVINTGYRQLSVWKGKNYPQNQTANN